MELYEDTLEKYYNWHQCQYGKMPELWEDPANHGNADHLIPTQYRGRAHAGPSTPRRQAKFIQICKENGINESSSCFPSWA
jgi:hypothetical protein